MTVIATRTAAVPDPPQLVPPIAIKPDRNRPIIILVSLLLHAMILLPLLLPKKTAPPQAQEIPVELVHEQPPAPKPPPPTPPPRKQEAAKPQPKPQEQKPPEQKPQEKAKPPEPPKQEQKPDPPKKPEEKTSPDSTTERMKKLLGEDAPPIDSAIAMPGASMDGTDGVSYHQLVMSKIAKAKRDILIAGKPGSSVVVAFTLSDTGAVADVSIKSPSGSPDLDKEALAMVGRGEPFPPPPPGAKRDFTFGLTMRSGP